MADVLRIVYVLTIGKRADGLAFQVADKRLRRFKVRSSLQMHLAQTRKWEQRRDRHPKDKR